MAHRQLGFGRFDFTATKNIVQTIAIKREWKQTEQNKKYFESSKRDHLFHLGKYNF